MGFLDNIKDRLRGDSYEDDYYEDDYYDDGADQGGYGRYDDEPRQAADPAPSRGLLGNTPRPEAESVSVYTRSGRAVAPAPAATSAAFTPVTPTPQPASAAPVRNYAPQQPVSTQTHSHSYETQLGAPTTTPADLGLTPKPRMSSGQLPPYVLRPVSYDDVQTVVRRVKTSQPVVLVFRNTNIETAKRILDFCFGLSFGLEGAVQELGDRVFAVLPEGISLSDADINKLVADGDLVR